MTFTSLKHRGSRHELKPRDAADLIGVHPNTITQWVNEGRLPCLRAPSGHRRYDPDHIRHLATRQPFVDGLWAVQVRGQRIVRAAASFQAAAAWVAEHNATQPATANVTTWPGSPKAHATVLQLHVRKAIR